MESETVSGYRRVPIPPDRMIPFIDALSLLIDVSTEKANAEARRRREIGK